MLEQRIEQDLKAAMLAGDKFLTTTLRGLKNTILYAKVAAGSRDQDMPDGDVVLLLQKEAKKRQESADLYKRGGNAGKAESELEEKIIIEKYLPTLMTEQEVERLVGSVMGELNIKEVAHMGRVIAEVRQRSNGRADGALIARLVKERFA